MPETETARNQPQLPNTGRSAPGPTVAAKCGEPSGTQADKSTEKSDTEQHNRTNQPAESLLVRYGPCVRSIPDVITLCMALKDAHVASVSYRIHQQPSDMPSEFELVERFLSRCPCLRLPKVYLSQYHIMDSDLSKMVMKYIIPAAVHLAMRQYKLHPGGELEDDYYTDDYYTDDDGTDDNTDDQRDIDDDEEIVIRQDGHVIVPIVMMKLVLIHTSSNLQTLNIDMAAPWVTSRSYICHDCLTRGSDFVNGIKKLRICKAGWGPGSIKCWKWIWKHVTNLESLQVQDASPDFVSCLERGISTHMHRLERIHLGRKTENIKEDRVHFYDSAIARVLESGTRLKSIYLDMSARAKRATLRALPLHYSTLTEFTIEISTGTDSALIKILALCPKLRKLVTIQHGEYAFTNKFMPHAGHQIFPEVDAKVFADLHPRTKVYRPWACESTLETLQIKIGGIPWDGDEVDSISCEEDQDSMPSEHDDGTAILQRQVYGRLARLTNLKTLWLGHDPMVADQYGLYGGCYGDVQKECLEMTLPSGLAVLGTLKKLKHLNMQGLFHYKDKFGAEEVNWMFDNWPEMEKIWGIDLFGPAHDWLEKHRPSLLGEPTELWEEDLALSDTYLADSGSFKSDSSLSD